MNFIDRICEDEPLSRELFEGVRVVTVHDDVYQAAVELMERDATKIAGIAKFTCWPDYNTWIEIPAPKGQHTMGFLFYGGLTKKEQSVTAGHGLVFIGFPDGEIMAIPVRYDLESYSLVWADHHQLALKAAKTSNASPAVVSLLSGYQRSMTDPLLIQAQYAGVLSHAKPLMFSLLAFINSPKLVRVRECDKARLNARRIKRGKYPFHPHHEVRLNIDKHILSITQGQGDGPERELHFVRAHLRFLVHPRYKNVSVTLVQPHYRGNPELGILNTSYAIDRTNSRWRDVE